MPILNQNEFNARGFRQSKKHFARFLACCVLLVLPSSATFGDEHGTAETTAVEPPTQTDSALQIRSVEPIEGAFGATLGQSRDSILDYARRRVKDRLYIFETTKPDPNFDRYLIMFNESNELVVSITALGSFPGTTEEQCDERFRIYHSELERKHGDGEIVRRTEKRSDFELQNITGTRKIFFIREYDKNTCVLQFTVTEMS